ncbi:ISL3 family transposase [Intrasporangium calvum]|uniref:ISL3 family transposase n=1 Tax=Intrasporangium calvum TaxID=53358 RepID=UPI0018FF65A2|nr:ISL3 family transposase [Intrasporangium calvum]
MRATTLLNNVLALPGARVVGVDPDAPTGAGPVEVTLALTRRRLACPHCSYTTSSRYDRRDVDSVWRHLDLAGRICRLRMRRRRLACPVHGVLTEGVPFARPGAGFSRDFEDLIVWLTTRSDKTTVATFARVAWRTVGAMCERVAADVLDPDRLAGLVEVGVDEISWRKHHRYLTLVTDHATSTVVWGAPGRDAATLGTFFDELGRDAERLEAVSMDLGPAYAKAVRERAPDAVICFDPFHVVQLATKALDSVRRQVWQSARRLPDQSLARTFKGSRWALLKNPTDLTDAQAQTLKGLRRNGGALWRAYQLKEALRAIFVGDLTPTQVMDLLARWCSRAQRSRIPDFVKTAATIRKHTDGIAAAIDRKLSNGRHEGLNNKIRTMTRRAYGFHSPEAALALIMLTCGPTTLKLPYQT